MTVKFVLLFLILVTALITDILNSRIPNWLTLPAIIIGLGVNFISDGAGGLIFGIEGLFLGIALFIILYIMGGMGAGDVKLMGAVGAMIGPHTVLMAALYTAIAGGIYAFAIIMFHPKARATRTALAQTVKELIYFHSFSYNRPQNQEKPPKLCYGVAIAIGTIAAVVIKA